MDCAWVSSESRAPHSVHSGLRQTFRELDTPWNFRGATMAPLCSRTGLVGANQREGADFSWTKPGIAHTNQTWNTNQMNGSIPILLVQRKCNLHNVFIVVYDIDGVILHPSRQIINAAYYCTFLQHHHRPAFRRKRRNSVVPNPIILHDNARNHTAAAVMDLFSRWQWEILEQQSYSPAMMAMYYSYGQRLSPSVVKWYMVFDDMMTIWYPGTNVAHDPWFSHVCYTIYTNFLIEHNIINHRTSAIIKIDLLQPKTFSKL